MTAPALTMLRASMRFGSKEQGMAALLAVGLGVLLMHGLDRGVDWYTTYYPACRAVLAGRSPYDLETFYNPPWSLLPLLPLALLPPRAGHALYLAVMVVSLWAVARRLGASRLGALLCLCTPPAANLILTANLDWLVLAAVLVPPRWGLLLALVKPQAGAALAVYWLAEAWRAGGVRQVVSVSAPVALALLGSVALYGAWWETRSAEHLALGFNAALPFPLGATLGIALLVWSLRRGEPGGAVAASPFFAPYAALHSWTGAMTALARRPFVLAAVTAGLWLLIYLAGAA